MGEEAVVGAGATCRVSLWRLRKDDCETQPPASAFQQ